MKHPFLWGAIRKKNFYRPFPSSLYHHPFAWNMCKYIHEWKFLLRLKILLILISANTLLIIICLITIKAPSTVERDSPTPLLRDSIHISFYWFSTHSILYFPGFLFSLIKNSFFSQFFSLAIFTHFFMLLLPIFDLRLLVTHLGSWLITRWQLIFTNS